MTKTALNKEAIWRSIGYRPHAGQKKVHRSTKRNKVIAAGRRLGKSFLGGHELTVEAASTFHQQARLKDESKRREFWIVGPEYSDAEKEFRVVWNDLTKLGVPMDKPGSYNSPWAGEMSISLYGGLFQVHAKSAKYPGTLVGEGLSGVILAEAAKLKPSVWVKYLRPTLADFRGWSIMTSTPEGRNWFYEQWLRGQDPDDEGWDSWRMPAWVNEYVFPIGGTQEGVDMIRSILKDPDQRLTAALIKASGLDPEIVDMMRDMTEERFDQEILAKFTEHVGLVFKNFDEEWHVRSLTVDPNRPVYLAVDYGFQNPFVALAIQVDVFDRVKVLAEYRVQHRDIEDIAKDLIVERGGLFSRANLLYPDPASPGDSSLLAKHLKVRPMGNTGGELKWRLEQIRQALKLLPEHGPIEEKQANLQIDRSCVELIREMNAYRYPDTKEERGGEAPENPLKKDDHGPEALGRFFRGFFGGPASKANGNRAKVRRAKVSA
jgi:hypothetical protein